MTTGLWNATMSEQRGAVAPPADLDRYMVVMGCTSSGNTGLRGPFATARAVVATCGYGDTCDTAGQVAEQRQTNGSQVAQVPVCVYEVPAATNGAYGTLDDSGVAGTAVITVDSDNPFGTYRAAVQIVNGGILGTTGITYRTSLDVEPDWNAIAPKRLGTALTIAIPNSGCGFVLNPSTTNAAYVALAVELRADVLAHLANNTAHDGADTSAEQVALAASSIPATVSASTAVVNLVLAALLSHVVNITSVHDGPDLVAFTALDALSVATDTKTGIDLAIALKGIANTHMGVALTASTAGLMGATASVASPQTYTAAGDFLAGGVAALDAQPRRLKITIAGSGTPSDMPNSVDLSGFDYAGDAQTETGLDLSGLGTVYSTKAWKGTGLSAAFATGQGTGASFQTGYSNGVHNSADVTNTITSADPTYGTLDAGDSWFVYTMGPQPDATAIDDAYVALSKSAKLFGIVAHEFNMTPTLAAHVTTGLGVCLATNRRMIALGHTDMPDLETSETESDWQDSVETAFEVGTVDDSRIILFSSFLRETDARTTNVYRRPGFAQFCADVVRVPINEPPCAPADQPATGLSLWTSDDVQVGHDEGPRGDVTGLSNADMGNRFVSTVSTADPLRGNAVHYTVPWTLAAADDLIKTLMMRRIATSMERAAVSAAVGSGGTLLDYTAPDPNVPGDVYRLTPESRGALHGTIFNALSTPYAPFIQNADDGNVETGLVWINPVITVAAGKLVSVEYEIRCRFQGVLVTLTGTFVVKE